VREYHNSDASDVTIDLPGAVFFVLPVAKYQMYPTISCKASVLFCNALIFSTSPSTNLGWIYLPSTGWANRISLLTEHR
jgi:hypothetical protein